MVRFDTTAREIARAIDEVLDDAWLGALNDEDFAGDFVISVVTDELVIEVRQANLDTESDVMTDTIDTAVIGLPRSERATTTPARFSTVDESQQLRARDYEAWYAAYIAGELPERLPRSRAPRGTSTMRRSR